MTKLIIIFLILYLVYISSKTMIRSQTSPKTDSTFDDNPYEILNVSPDSTEDEIKNAYREKSKKNHPDLVGHMSTDFQKLAEEKLKEINWAYQEIKKSRGFKA